jgi:hypothetical protein
MAPNVVIITGDAAEDLEFFCPYQRLLDAGLGGPRRRSAPQGTAVRRARLRRRLRDLHGEPRPSLAGGPHVRRRRPGRLRRPRDPGRPRARAHPQQRAGGRPRTGWAEASGVRTDTAGYSSPAPISSTPANGRRTGRWHVTPSRWRRACPASSRRATSDTAPPSASPARSATAPSPSRTVGWRSCKANWADRHPRARRVSGGPRSVQGDSRQAPTACTHPNKSGADQSLD